MKFTLTFEYIKVTVETKASDFENFKETSKWFAESLEQQNIKYLNFGNFAALDQLVDHAISIYLAEYPHKAKCLDNEWVPGWDSYEDPDWD